MDIKLGSLLLKDCEVDIIMEKYSRREPMLETEGDDLVDLGRKSYEFEVRGKMNFHKFKRLDKEVRKRGNFLNFEFGEFKVVVKKLTFKSSGDFIMEMVEDVIWET